MTRTRPLGVMSLPMRYIKMDTKIPIPEPTDILNQLLSPSDIDAMKFEDMQTLAQSNSDALRQEFKRREKLDGIKEALENEDYDLLKEIFTEMYGQSMISAGKQMLISFLALRGKRVENETHIEHTIGMWIEEVYETTGIEGLYDWATKIDIAMQVVDEYEVVFDSEIAKQSRNQTSEFNQPVDWQKITQEDRDTINFEDEDDSYIDFEDDELEEFDTIDLDDENDITDTISLFEEIRSIGNDTARKLVEAGYTNIEELAESSPEDLKSIQGIGSVVARVILNNAQEYLVEQSQDEVSEDTDNDIIGGMTSDGLFRY